MVRPVVSTLVVLLAGCSGAVALEPTLPSQTVMLTTAGSPSCGPAEETALANRVLPDGTRVPFTLPAGQVLVVTGMAWNIFGQTPNQLKVVSVGAKPNANVIALKFVTAALADGTGRATGSVLVPNVVVRSAPGLPICAGGISTQSSGGVFVYGFLTTDN
jgi:hypothetical protein